MIDSEVGGINQWEYPLGYFEAQVAFASKWAQIAGIDLGDAIETKTAIPRRLGLNSQELREALESAENIAQAAFTLYCSDEDNLYKPGSGSMMGYDYHPDTGVVKIHFTNIRRGEKPFDTAGMRERRKEMRLMLEEIKREHPEALKLMSASWLRSTRSYLSLSPPDVPEPVNIMSKDMKFGGNSLWGQFINFKGHTNDRVYEAFLEALESAETLEDLLDAFPYPVRLSEDDIQGYYDFYGVLSS